MLEWDERKRLRPNVAVVFKWRGELRRIISMRRARTNESKNMTRYSADELRNMVARGESRTDLAAVRKMTEAELEAQIAADPDFSDFPKDWHVTATAVRPAKKLLSLRLDDEVVDWFKRQGPGYQTRINEVLLAFVRHRR